MVGEPDAAQVFEVAKILEGVEGDVHLAVDVVIALLHFGLEDADDGEATAIEADALADRIAATEEFGLRLGSDNGNVSAVLIVLLGEEAALVDVKFENIGDFGAVAVNLPGIHVLVAADVDLLEHGRRDVDDAGNGGPQAVDVFLGEADLNTSFRATDLLRGTPGEDPDQVGAPLGKNVADGLAESCSVREQEHDSCDAPRHSHDGDEGAAAVVDHRFPGLAPNVTDHVGSPYSRRSASTGSMAAA